MTNDVILRNEDHTFQLSVTDEGVAVTGLDMVITIQRKSDDYYWNSLTPAWQSELVTNDMSEVKDGLYELDVTVAQGFFTDVTGKMYITYYGEDSDGVVVSFSKNVDTHDGAPAPNDMATSTGVDSAKAEIIGKLVEGHIILEE